MSEFDQFIDYLHELRGTIEQQFAQLEQQQFASANWQSSLGKGSGRVIEGGTVFDRVGINISTIQADKLPPAASTKRQHLAGKPYTAGGISLIAHPHNPHAPTVHMNLRSFLAYDPTSEDNWWFGGGMDLTPCYGFDEDCQHFHLQCKQALQPHGNQLYPRYKQACDEYFYLPHRKLQRGIGGIFFDDYASGSYADGLALVQSVGNAFSEAYLPIVKRRSKLEFSEQQRKWQSICRGRYVEFNLLYDRGTKFGLQSGGNPDAIFTSMPPNSSWSSSDEFAAGSDEDLLLTKYLQPTDWA